MSEKDPFETYLHNQTCIRSMIDCFRVSLYSNHHFCKLHHLHIQCRFDSQVKRDQRNLIFV